MTAKQDFINGLRAYLDANPTEGVGVLCAITGLDGCETLMAIDSALPIEVIDGALTCLVGSWWRVAYDAASHSVTSSAFPKKGTDSTSH